VLWKKTAVAKRMGFTKMSVVRRFAEIFDAISPLKTATVM